MAILANGLINFKKRYFKIWEKNMLKNLINHRFFGTWPTNFVPTFKKNKCKISNQSWLFWPTGYECTVLKYSGLSTGWMIVLISSSGYLFLPKLKAFNPPRIVVGGLLLWASQGVPWLAGRQIFGDVLGAAVAVRFVTYQRYVGNLLRNPVLEAYLWRKEITQNLPPLESLTPTMQSGGWWK